MEVARSNVLRVMILKDVCKLDLSVAYVDVSRDVLKDVYEGPCEVPEKDVSKTSIS